MRNFQSRGEIRLEINIGRDGIKNTDEPVALIYYGRYEVNSWSQLFYAAVKALFIEYPEVINRLISKEPNRVLYLRTTTIDMKEPMRISTILYLDVSRTPLEIVSAIREIFARAEVLNINMSIEIRRAEESDKIQKKYLTQESQIIQSKQNSTLIAPKLTPNVMSDISKTTPVLTPTKILPPSPPNLEVPSFMKSQSIRKATMKENYIEQMKYLAQMYPKQMKAQIGKFLNHRRITLAESGYRYFIEEVEIGAGLSVEINFTDEQLKENLTYYNKLFLK